MTPLRIEYPISVAILYTSYDPDTVEVARQMNEALTSRGHKVRMFEATSRNWKKALRVPGDVVINWIEDENTDWKLWAKVGRHLELLHRAQLGFNSKLIPYSLSKIKMKRRLIAADLSTPSFRVIRKHGSKTPFRGLNFPLIVKPAGEHASTGISQDSVVIDYNEMFEQANYLFKKYGGEILLEEFIDGHEIHITVIGNKRHVIPLPYVLVDYKGEYRDNWPLLSHNAKWDTHTWEYWDSKQICPVVYHKKIMDNIDNLVKTAFKVLGCVDIVRFDIRLDQKYNPYIIDTNINPHLGYFDQSECWQSAMALGWTYADFIETLVAICYKRHFKRLPDRLRERQFMLAGI
jgi:D-alanine-D-alanine ligase